MGISLLRLVVRLSELRPVPPQRQWLSQLASLVMEGLGLGPVPPPPPPAPPTPSGPCEDFSGDWIDNTSWFAPAHFSQSGCSGTFEGKHVGGLHSYTVDGSVLTTSNDFMGGLTGTIKFRGVQPQDIIEWSNG